MQFCAPASAPPGTPQVMFINSSGNVGIGTATATLVNTRLAIIGTSTGYSQPLIQINQNGSWGGKYALQVTGYTIVNGLKINGDDDGIQ
jgi:hypothetical protein